MAVSAAATFRRQSLEGLKEARDLVAGDDRAPLSATMRDHLRAGDPGGDQRERLERVVVGAEAEPVAAPQEVVRRR
ncbi:hypothetical protein [Actinoallomurus iriomotensis]|uniref:hypothetical protein n=1 Tax=Actinoallomurus iriomotensis TaxID=478107 RepID=UPI002554DAB6|nr:hypothetical protein [Actinoallomurus iriomotensis]